DGFARPLGASFSGRQGNARQNQADASGDGTAFPLGGSQPLCADVGNPGEERRLAAACVEDRGKRDWKYHPRANRGAGGGRNSRRRFTRRSAAQIESLSENGRSNDQ